MWSGVTAAWVALLLGVSGVATADGPPLAETTESAPGAAVVPAPEPGGEIFLPEYFARFAPQTALDMVEALPGFLIRQRESSRGLGQGGTNILIDGQRVSGKSIDPVDVLGRTSAEQVVRIEILDGSSLGISGLSGAVANVVLDRSGVSGTLEWEPEFQRNRSARLTRGAASISGALRGIDYTVGFENDAFRNDLRGPETVFGPDLQVLERREERHADEGDSPTLSVGLSRTDAKGREANLNASYTVFDFDFVERSDRVPVDPLAPRRLRTTERGEDEWNGELSGDLSFDALGGRTKLIGFQYFESSEFVERSSQTRGGGFEGEDLFLSVIDEGESIVRVEQSYRLGQGRMVELAGEAVYNFVDFEAALFDVDASGGRTEVDLPGANSKVEERRAEVSGTYSVSIGERLDLQASAAVEISEIEQTGDASAERSFFRPKGFASLAYAWTSSVDLRARIDRRVGQLEFGAFASSVDLANDNESFGNSALVPQQSWFFQAAIEKRFVDSSSMTLTFDYEALEDVVQRIPIANPAGEVIGDGFGNVPDATFWRVEFIGTQRLERWGVPGGQIEWDVTFRESAIDDPFSGETRRLDGQFSGFYKLELRQDIPRTDYAYGVNFRDIDRSRTFRRDQISRFDDSRPALEVFVEDKDLFGLNARLYATNLADSSDDFRRDVFEGARPDAPFAFREDRRLSAGPSLGLVLAKTF